MAARVYDRSGRLTEVQNKKASTVLSRFQLTLDPVGNPTKIVRTGTPTETRLYIYDNLDRLKEVCFQATACTGGGDPFIRWTYDGVGNRLSEVRPGGSSTSYSYDSDDRLTSAGGTSYSFDDNGNQTAAGSRSFTYDLANRLKTTTLSGTTTTYSYTGDGRRSQATTGAGAANTTNYLWDIFGKVPQLAIERDGANTLLRRYTYGSDRIAMTDQSATFYYHYDDLGSVINLTNTSGATQSTETYEPYGTIKTETNVSGTAPDNPVKYAGEQTDPTGLTHLRARQYDPTTGRFTVRDPFPPPASDPYSSTYTYGLDQPTTLTDPTGLRWCRQACKAVDAIGPIENSTSSTAGTFANALRHNVAESVTATVVVLAGSTLMAGGVLIGTGCTVFTEGVATYECFDAGGWIVVSGLTVYGTGIGTFYDVYRREQAAESAEGKYPRHSSNEGSK